MKNIFFLAIISFWTPKEIIAQSIDSLRWVIPLQEGINLHRAASPTLIGYKQGNSLKLIPINGQTQEVPADSIAWLGDGWWKIWKNDLIGVYQVGRGIVIPCVFEEVKLTLQGVPYHTFLVSKYGMWAVVNDHNIMILPWQMATYSGFKSIGDTIVEYYAKKNYKLIGKGYISINGHIPADSTTLLAQKGIVRRIEQGKYALLKLRNDTISQDTFYSRHDFVGGYLPARKDSLYGYLRTDGSWLIPPSFQDGEPFFLGRATVKKNGKFGIIRMDGSWLLRPHYELLTPHGALLFQYTEGDKTGLIDTTGCVLLPAAKQRLYTADNGAFRSRINDSISLYYPNGDSIPINNITSLEFSGDLATVQSSVIDSNKIKRLIKGVINTNSGQWILPQMYTGDIALGDFFIVVEDRTITGKSSLKINGSGRFLLYDRQGKLVVPVKVSTTSFPGKSPFLTFLVNGKWGLLFKNTVILEPEYDEISFLQNGWILVIKGGKCGVLK